MKKLLFLLLAATLTIGVNSQRFINDYSESTPEDDDKLLGTDVSTASVKNFTVGSIATKIKSEVVDEATGITTVTVEDTRPDTTPIEMIVNALPSFTVAYNEQYIFDITVTSATGTAGYEIWLLKQPKGTFGVGGTTLTALDFQQLNSSFINDRNVLLTKSYGYWLDYPTNTTFFPWLGDAGDTMIDLIENLAGEDGDPTQSSFMYVGDVNQNIAGKKVFGNIQINVDDNPDITSDFTFQGPAGGGLGDGMFGVVLKSAPVTGMRITWTDGSPSETSSIRPYQIGSNKNLYFSELVGSNFADTMLLDAGNTIGDQSIDTEWDVNSPNFTISLNDTINQTMVFNQATISDFSIAESGSLLSIGATFEFLGNALLVFEEGPTYLDLRLGTGTNGLIKDGNESNSLVGQQDVIAGDGISITGSSSSADVTITADPGVFISGTNFRYRLLNNKTVHVQLTSAVTSGQTLTLPVGYRPIVTQVASIPSSNSITQGMDALVTINTNGDMVFSAPLASDALSGSNFIFTLD